MISSTPIAASQRLHSVLASMPLAFYYTLIRRSRCAVTALRFSGSFPLSLRSALPVLALAGALLSCERPTDPPPDTPQTSPLAPPAASDATTPSGAPRRSAAGAYLASRQAFVNRDLADALALMQQTLAFDPENTELRRHTLLMAVTTGRMDIAEAEATQLATRLPNDYYVALIQAVAAVRRDDFAAARQALTRLPTAELAGVWQPFLLAWLEAGEGRLTEATARLAEERHPPQLKPLAVLHQALLAQFSGDQTRAAALYARLGKELPQPPLRLVLFSGQVLTATQQTDAVTAMLRSYAEQATSPVLAARLQTAFAQQNSSHSLGLLRSAKDGMAEALLDIGDLLNQEHSRDLAIVHVRLALSLRPDLAYGWLILAQLLQQQDFLAAAAAACGKVPGDSPLGWQAQLQTADVRVLQDDPDGAIRLLEAMQQQEPDDLHVLTRIGELLRQQERFADAVPVYDQAIALVGKDPAPRAWALYYARGIALERIKDWSRAEADLRTALQLMPEQPQVLNYLAYSWIEQGIRLQEALEMLVRAVAQAPDDAYIIDSLGWAYYKLGQYDAAVMHLERAVALRPYDPMMIDHLGDAYWQQGRQREARFQWRHALDFNPAAADTLRIQAKLANGL